MSPKNKLEKVEPVEKQQPALSPEMEPKKEPLQLKPEPEKGKERMSFTITNDKIEWDALQDKTRKRLIELLRNSPPPGSGIAKEPPFSDETMTVLCAGIGYTEAIAATKWPLKIPKEIAFRIYPYDADQAKKLGEALNKVAAKYEWLNSIKYKEEFDLLGLFVAFTAEKTVQALHLKGEFEKRNAEEAKNDRPGANAPAPKNFVPPVPPGVI